MQSRTPKFRSSTKPSKKKWPGRRRDSGAGGDHHPLLGAQAGIGGGGRYDGLMESIGGASLSGIGFGLGTDRTLLACDDEGVFAPPATEVSVFVVDTTGGAEALAITAARRPAIVPMPVTTPSAPSPSKPPTRKSYSKPK